jgi:hypothetical protein
LFDWRRKQPFFFFCKQQLFLSAKGMLHVAAGRNGEAMNKNNIFAGKKSQIISKRKK